MDVPRIVKTQITTGELDAPADLTNGTLPAYYSARIY